MPLVEKYIKVCEELGLEQDKELNEKLNATINYKMLYQPGDLEDYSKFSREGIIITRFAVDRNYILYNPKNYLTDLHFHPYQILYFGQHCTQIPK